MSSLLQSREYKVSYCYLLYKKNKFIANLLTIYLEIFIYVHTMSLNIVVLLVVIVVQYVFGAVWYSLIFQKQWMEINHPEGTPSKAEMERLGKEATPYYIIQLVMTALTACAQWYFISLQPNNWFTISFWLWLGFLVPGIVQTIIWSDPKNKKKVLQMGIMALNLFLLTMFAGWAFVTFK
jgi:Protein of unknown function (DUF1761)